MGLEERLSYNLEGTVTFVNCSEDGRYIDEGALWDLEKTEGKPVVVIGRRRGSMKEFLESQGLELTGDGFAELIFQGALKMEDTNPRLTFLKALDRAKRWARYCGTSMDYWGASTDAIDSVGEQHTVTLLQFVTRKDLFPLRSGEIVRKELEWQAIAISRGDIFSLPLPGRVPSPVLLP